MKQMIILFITLLLTAPYAHAERKLLDRVAAVVNDEIITQSELDAFLRPIYEQLKEETSGRELAMQMNEIRRKLLNQLIEDKLAFQKAQELGVEVSESEIERQLEEFRKGFPSEQAMEETLRQEGVTLNTLRERLRRQSMIRQLHQSEVRSKVVVSPLEIDEYYKEHRDEFSSEDKLKVRSLTIKKGPEAREKGIKDERAESLVRELRKKIIGGEDFAEITRQYSEDTRAQQGGLGDWIERGNMIPVIDNVIFKLEIGAVSDIIETEMGYHLFRVEEREEGTARTLEESRDDILNHLLAEKFRERFEEWMEELKREAYISIQ